MRFIDLDLEQRCQIWIRSRSGTLPGLNSCGAILPVTYFLLYMVRNLISRKQFHSDHKNLSLFHLFIFIIIIIIIIIFFFFFFVGEMQSFEL